MKAISYLGKLEKQLGVPVTTRNWNTIEKVVRVLTDR
jgi:maleate cis-trans isomerase